MTLSWTVGACFFSFARSFFLSLNSRSSWNRLISTTAIDCMEFCRRLEVRSGNPLRLPILGEMEREGLVFALKVVWRGRSQRV